MSPSAIERTLGELVAINSINPALPGGVADAEGRVCAWIADFCRKHSLEFETMEVAPGRPNLLVRVPGRDERRALLLEAHTDVVAVEGYRGEPFTPFVREGRLYGRGACDTKASLTAMLHTMLVLKQQPPPVTVYLLAAMSEEIDCLGIKHFVEHWLPRLDGTTFLGAVVGEPTGFEIVRAHKGSLRWKIVTRGRAAHSARPDLGVNAIHKMAGVIRAIEDQILPQLARRTHSLLGPPTMNIGVIQGGVQVNFVPDQCWIEVDRRLLPGETSESILAELDAVLDPLRRNDPDLTVEHQGAKFDPPLETPAEADIVLAAARVVDRALGRHAIVGAPYCTDASKLALAGIPTIVLGPGHIAQAHTTEEWVELRQVEQAVALYLGIAREP
ncbi:MAG: M20 family metallopeptidase [Verrucomicrobiae bacterium]|nr:M20 family metallopeptidase [Verrucomicrobiae bacterium]